MKKSQLLVLGLIALVLAGGLALASCETGCPGGFTSGGKGKCESGMKQCKDNCISNQKKKNPFDSGYSEYKCDC